MLDTLILHRVSIKEYFNTVTKRNSSLISLVMIVSSIITFLLVMNAVSSGSVNNKVFFILVSVIIVNVLNLLALHGHKINLSLGNISKLRARRFNLFTSGSVVLYYLLLLSLLGAPLFTNLLLIVLCACITMMILPDGFIFVFLAILVGITGANIDVLSVPKVLIDNSMSIKVLYYLIFFHFLIIFVYYTYSFGKFLIQIRVIISDLEKVRVEGALAFKKKDADLVKKDVYSESLAKGFFEYSLKYEYKQMKLKEVGIMLDRLDFKDQVKFKEIMEGLDIIINEDAIPDKFNHSSIEINPEFINMIESQYPGHGLNEKEILIIQTLSSGITKNNELAKRFNSSAESIRVTKSRIKNKLGLTKKDDLNTYFSA